MEQVSGVAFSSSHDIFLSFGSISRHRNQKRGRRVAHRPRFGQQQFTQGLYRNLLYYLSLRVAFFVVLTAATRQIDARMSRASFAALALDVPRPRQQAAKFGGIPMLAARNVDHSPKTKHDVGRKLHIVERIVIPCRGKTRK